MSAVATLESDASLTEPSTWNRTPEQQQIVDEHLARVQRQYADMNADPRLVAMLSDTTPIGTAEIMQDMKYLRSTRVFQLYGLSEKLAAADQIPHPSAIPTTDASPGTRGANEIRGVARGRWGQWTLQSGRKRWDPIRGQIVKQTGVSHGGHPRRA